MKYAMRKNKIQILSTKLIGTPLTGLQSTACFSIDEIPFIETEAIDNPGIEKKIIELSKQNLTVIFTSANAVKAIKKYLPSQLDWKIFCIGHKTKNIVAETFGESNIIGTADYGEQLAAKVIKHPLPGRTVFFSGNQRRDVLPAILNLNGIELEELVVYNTIEKPQALSKTYDAILFFSPSAVRSFFTDNTISTKTQIFAIGDTTANEIKLFTKLPVITSRHPDIEELLQHVINHFNPIKTT